MLEGQNILCLDLETAHSADDCRYCGHRERQHGTDGVANVTCPDGQHEFHAIGWNNHAALGLSIGCWFDYQDGLYHWFDPHTLEATMRLFLERQPLIVSFNGVGFDSQVMAALVPEPVTPDGEPASDFPALWDGLWASSYDILARIWVVDPDNKFTPGLNRLGAISVANGYGAKEMDGAQAPRLWRAGHYAEVLEYCRSDVTKTKRLFEQIVQTGQLLRGDGKPIRLPLPTGWAIR